MHVGVTVAALVARFFRGKTRAEGKSFREKHAYFVESEPILGQDKYLGGALGSDDCVYG